MSLMIADGFLTLLPSEIIEKRKSTFEIKVSKCNSYCFSVCFHYYRCIFILVNKDYDCI